VVTGAAAAEPLMKVFHRGPVTSSDHSRTFISASTPRSHHRRHACSPSFPDAVPPLLVHAARVRRRGGRGRGRPREAAAPAAPAAGEEGGVHVVEATGERRSGEPWRAQER
jgi:hypothetical protein